MITVASLLSVFSIMWESGCSMWSLQKKYNMFVNFVYRYLPPSCSSADAWNESPSCRRTTHWYIPLSSRVTPVTCRVSPTRPELGSCRPSLNHVICCGPAFIPLAVTRHRNSAVPPIWTLSTFGDISTWIGVDTVSRRSALASPPAFEAEHLYTPPSSLVTASMASTGPSSRIRGPDETGIGSGPLWVYHLKWKKKWRRREKRKSISFPASGGTELDSWWVAPWEWQLEVSLLSNCVRPEAGNKLKSISVVSFLKRVKWLRLEQNLKLERLTEWCNDRRVEVHWRLIVLFSEYLKRYRNMLITIIYSKLINKFNNKSLFVYHTLRILRFTLWCLYTGIEVLTV